MVKTAINSIEFKNMILNAGSLLSKNKDYVDSLNVFPVPDGDTGTNMNLTMQSVIREIENAGDDIKSISNAIALGSLKGARGNSGVILSQILKGFSKMTAGAESIDVELLKEAFKNSSELAYKAVMKPKEGTILTVCKEIADAASEVETDDLIKFFEFILERGKAMLDRTPEMLPVLKEAGVVDSGGMGLIIIITGMLNYLKDEDVEIDFTKLSGLPKQAETAVSDEEQYAAEHENSKFTYCVEYTVLGNDAAKNDELNTKLDVIGDCVHINAEGDVTKVHVHTDHPGKALEYALKAGALDGIKVENMTEMKKNAKKAPVSPRKSVAMITVSVGEGFDEVFKQLAADVIIKGGQSMNPSVEDFMKAIDSVRSENVIILPNNKNIILACEQVAQVSEKNVQIIATRSLPEGINAAMMFNPDGTIEENVEAMKEAMEDVHSVQITNAVRTTNINDLHIEEGDFLGVVDDDIKACGKEIETVVLDSLAVEELEISDQVITLFYGTDVEEEDAEKISAVIAEKYPDVEVDVAFGGQPLYPYIISVE